MSIDNRSKRTKIIRWRSRKPRFTLRTRRTARSSQGQRPPRSGKGRHFLLTDAELAFYKVLRDAVENRWELSLKTRLADVVGCPDALWNRPYGRRISQKHVDFVLFDPMNGAICAVVELDDPTHYRTERRKRDRFLNGLLAREAIPLVRFYVRRHYDTAQLRCRLDSAMCASPVDPCHADSTLERDVTLNRRDEE